MRCRFSPLWQPAGVALAEALTQNPKTAWPIILQHITQTQQQFLAGNYSNSHSADQQHGAEHGSTHSSSSFDLQQQYETFCQQGYGVAAAASGSCTDAANRLTNLLKGLSAKTSAGVLHQVSDDWVPLLLSFAAAVTHAGSSEEEIATDADDTGLAAGDEQHDREAAAAAGSKRKHPEASAETKQHDQLQQQQRSPKRQRSGLGAAVSREGLGSLGFSLKAWRGVMMEWLGLLGALKNPQKLNRWVWAAVNG